MPQSSSPRTLFVTRKVDEFEKKTITSHTDKYAYHAGNGFVFSLGLRRVEVTGHDLLVLDCDIRSFDNSWFFARDGKIIFKVGEETESIDFEETNTDVQTVGDKTMTLEVGYYSISPQLLDKLCSANELKIRIVGGKDYVEPDAKECLAILTHFQRFYNNVYDESKYQHAVAVKKTGCFIATAAMGSFDDPVVLLLRQFRDRVLVHSRAGNVFVEVYYKLSPTLAENIEGKPVRRAIVKWVIVLPAYVTARLVLKSSKHCRSCVWQ